jgi:ADP-heptose:LPS heptosyltransferase
MILKRLERGWKRILLALIIPFLKPPPLARSAIAPADLKSILVIRHDHRLGNLVLVTPFLAGLRRFLPQARVTFLAASTMAEILKGQSGVDHLWILNKRSLLKNPFYLVKTLIELKKGQYQAAFDLSHPAGFSMTGALIAALSGAEYRIGFQRGPARKFFNLTAPVPDPGTHESRAIAGLLSAVGIEPAPDRPRVHLNEKELEEARRSLQYDPETSGSPLIAVHPGGRDRKRWGRERFAALVDFLVQRGAAILLILGPMEEDLPTNPENASRIIRQRPAAVRELGAILAQASLFISGDTGPMHLAAAVGVPCLSIFTEPAFDRYAPVGYEHKVLFDPDGRLDPETVADEAARMEERK